MKTQRSKKRKDPRRFQKKPREPDLAGRFWENFFKNTRRPSSLGGFF